MNFAKRIPSSSNPDLARSKLALITLCSVCLTAAISKQLPAQAAERSAQVSLAGLDLSTSAGMEAARKRLVQTAQRLCGRAIDPWTLSAHPDYVHCVDEAMIAAMGQIHELVRVADAKSHASAISGR